MPSETPFDPEFINAIITGDPISSGKGLENTEPVRPFAEEAIPEDVIEDFRASKLPKTNPFTHSLSDSNSRETPPQIPSAEDLENAWHKRALDITYPDAARQDRIATGMLRASNNLRFANTQAEAEAHKQMSRLTPEVNESQVRSTSRANIETEVYAEPHFVDRLTQLIEENQGHARNVEFVRGLAASLELSNLIESMSGYGNYVKIDKLRGLVDALESPAVRRMMQKKAFSVNTLADIDTEANDTFVQEVVDATGAPDVLDNLYEMQTIMQKTGRGAKVDLPEKYKIKGDPHVYDTYSERFGNFADEAILLLDVLREFSQGEYAFDPKKIKDADYLVKQVVRAQIIYGTLAGIAGEIKLDVSVEQAQHDQAAEDQGKNLRARGVDQAFMDKITGTKLGKNAMPVGSGRSSVRKATGSSWRDLPH